MECSARAKERKITELYKKVDYLVKEWHILDRLYCQFNKKVVLIMIINKIHVSNYKNLFDCNVSPKGLSALTGCNSSGKSNFIEVFQFISTFIAGSDEDRTRLLVGVMPNRTRWTPAFGNVENFSFLLECVLKTDNSEWELIYELNMAQPHFYPNGKSTPSQVLLERVCLKEVGKPGKATEVILRKEDGETKATRTEEPRKKDEFKTKSDMSALHALEVREADSFARRYPILFEFKRSLVSSNLLLLNPRKLMRNAYRTKFHQYSNNPGTIIEDFPLYDLIQEIKKGDECKEFDAWLKKLCSIDEIVLHESVFENDSNKEKEKERFTIVLIHQFKHVVLPENLSTGCAMMMGILISIYTFLRGNGFILLEEPETYLHPKAIIDLVQLLRNISQTKTVLFSTHSPVVLNSMRPEEVTLMIPTKDWKATTRNVADIKEATDALHSEFINFGDLLQTDFNLQITK
jgi:hypothetical protein